MPEKVLKTVGLTKSFKGNMAVDDLTLEVEEGDVFGFLGPNGAGKSTTIRLMLALIKPDAGDVEIFGDSIRRHGNRALRNVGALIEEADFYRNLSAEHNLQLLARMDGLSGSRVGEVLKTVGLYDRRKDKVKTYSHGMKQRLGLAQALLNHPKLLILDEPTSGLDPRGMKDVRELIRRLAREGMTIFLSSHLLDEVEKVCTSMAIINRGKLIIAGRVQELLVETHLFASEIRVRPLEKAVAVISQLDFVKRVESLEDSVRVAATEDQLAMITRKLVEEGVEVLAVIPRTSLEDYFLSITEEGEGNL
ncbi:MAG: ABC transporter ATP-binding protein [Fidelibacterota bacterium]